MDRARNLHKSTNSVSRFWTLCIDSVYPYTFPGPTCSTRTRTEAVAARLVGPFVFNTINVYAFVSVVLVTDAPDRSASPTCARDLSSQHV